MNIPLIDSRRLRPLPNQGRLAFAAKPDPQIRLPFEPDLDEGLGRADAPEHPGPADRPTPRA